MAKHVEEIKTLGLTSGRPTASVLLGARFGEESAVEYSLDFQLPSREAIAMVNSFYEAVTRGNARWNELEALEFNGCNVPSGVGTALDAALWMLFDDAYVGVMPLIQRTGELCLESRDFNTQRSPGKLGPFGRRIRSNEIPSVAAVEQIRFETGCRVHADQLFPIRLHVDERLRTLRIIYALIFGGTPANLGTGASSVVRIAFDRAAYQPIVRQAHDDLRKLTALIRTGIARLN